MSVTGTEGICLAAVKEPKPTAEQDAAAGKLWVQKLKLSKI